VKAIDHKLLSNDMGPSAYLNSSIDQMNSISRLAKTKGTVSTRSKSTLLDVNTTLIEAS